MGKPTIGSLFDGIGGFPLAAVHNGMTPVWASEIEAFPIKVTEIRFPGMIHVGDITKLDGARLPPVDVVCGGSPCQDLSVAGKRQGLAGERSGLFMEQVRIVKEMREANGGRNIPDDLVRPRYLVWENVPGAFSSAGGEDFRAVLEEIVRVKDGSCHVPRPDAGRWEPAGAAILGDQFSLAWRVLDARYWGVAQRRRRIFLVADFGGLTAPEILFKQDGLFGNPAPGKREGQGAAGSVERSPYDTGGGRLTFREPQSGRTSGEAGIQPVLCLNDQGGERMDVTEDVTATLRAGMGSHQPLTVQPEESVALCLNPGFYGFRITGDGQAGTTDTESTVLCLNDQGGIQMHLTENMAGTLRAQEHGHQPLIMAARQQEEREHESGGPAGIGDVFMAGDTRVSLFENHGIDSRYSGPHAVAPTMSARYGTGGNNVPLVTGEPGSFCISGNIIDREVQNGGNGLGCQADLSYTLTATDHHAVYSRQRSDEFSENEVTATQSARQHKDATDLIRQPYQETVGTIGYTDYKGINSQYVTEDKCVIEKRNLIRRLTPLECERLQGFPDGWTDIPGASDSARYKALGNSVAIPCVDFVLRGIAYFLRKKKKTDS